jgi:hypothetical protein
VTIMKRFISSDVRGSGVISVALVSLALGGCEALKEKLDMRCQCASERIEMHEGTRWQMHANPEPKVGSGSAMDPTPKPIPEPERQNMAAAAASTMLRQIRNEAMRDGEAVPEEDERTRGRPKRAFCPATSSCTPGVVQSGPSPLIRDVVKQALGLRRSRMSTSRVAPVEPGGVTAAATPDAAAVPYGVGGPAAKPEVVNSVSQHLSNYLIATSADEKERHFASAVDVLAIDSKDVDDDECKDAHGNGATQGIPESAKEAYSWYVRGKEIYLSRRELIFGDGKTKSPLYLLNEGLTCRPRGSDWKNVWRCQNLTNLALPPSGRDPILDVCGARVSGYDDVAVNLFGVLHDRYCVNVSIVERKGLAKTEDPRPTNINRDSLQISLTCATGNDSTPGAVAGGSRPNSIAPPESS